MYDTLIQSRHSKASQKFILKLLITTPLKNDYLTQYFYTHISNFKNLKASIKYSLNIIISY